MVDVLHPHARRVGGDQHETQVAIAVFRGAGAHQGIDVIAPVCPRAPALGAVDHHLITLKACAGGDAGQIAANIGFGQAIGEEQLSPGQPRQELSLLLSAAVFREVHAAIKGGVDIGPGQARSGLRQFLDHRDGRDQILPGPTIGFGHGERSQAQFVQLAIDVPRPAMIAIPLDAGLARGMACNEPPDGVAQLADMFRLICEGDGGQRRGHHSPVKFGDRRSRKARTASARSAARLDSVS